MNGLNEEYNKYLLLIDEKEKLNSEIKKLIGKNDEESISRLNDLGKKIASVDMELSLYDENLVSIVNDYYGTLKELEKLNEELKLIEKYSKKVVHNNDKVEVLTAENRKKLINREDAQRYKELADKKRNLRRKINEQYRRIKNKETMIKKEEVKEVQKIEKKSVGVSQVFYYDSLSLDEKIVETRKRLERIFQSTKLPNQGKKVLVTFEGKKYYIPEKYKGRYNSTIAELNKLLKEKNKEKNVESVIENKEEITEKKSSIVVTASDSEINTKKTSSIVNEEKTNKILSVYNIDKKVSLELEKIENKLLDKRIIIKTASVKFAKNTISAYNTSKTFVKKVSKKTIKVTKEKLENLKGYLNIKGEILKGIKDGSTLKEAMEKVYGEEKEIHKDYIIVNRTANFNKNICQKVNTTKGNISKVSKKVVDAIKKPFDSLREKMHDDVERKVLEKEISILKQEALKKKEELKRIKIKSESGYIAMGTIIVVGILALGTLIFAIINNMLR